MASQDEIMETDSVLESQDPNIEYIIEDSDEETIDSDELGLRVGIIEESFRVLKNKSISNKKNLKTTACSLLIDEIRLTQKYERHKGKMFGYTEGIGKSPLHEPKKMATKAVIFMVISLNEDWKIPVGLFFVHNPDIKYFADTIEETLKRLDEHHIDIISITLNCISPHLSFALAEQLGAEIDSSKPASSIKSCFAHPSNGNMVHILYDIDIILAFLKRYWATERCLQYKTKKIDYSMCSDVKKIEEISLQQYGIDVMYDWIIIRKRLTYETESFGKTTGDAIQYLKDLGHPDFKDSSATIQFVKVLDLTSQISKVDGTDRELYPNLSQDNEKVWKPLVLNILSYIKQLRSTDRDTPEHLSIFKTYTTGMIVYFTSLLQIYANHVNLNSSTGKYVIHSLLPSRFALKNIRLGLLENVPGNMDLTALGMFKKMKAYTINLHLIN